MMIGDERGEAVLENVRVDLGRADVGVAEQLLNDAKVGPVLQQMAGEGVAQDVRRHLVGR